VVETSNSGITISTICSPSKHVIKSKQYITFLETLGNCFIAAGNYNAKHKEWVSRLILLRERELLKTIVPMNSTILSTGEFTYWPIDRKKIPDLSDFYIINDILKNSSNITSYLELSSDH